MIACRIVRLTSHDGVLHDAYSSTLTRPKLFGSVTGGSQEAAARSTDVPDRLQYCTIQSSAAVRDLGVYLDAELTMKQHINKTTTVCYYHLRRLRCRFVDVPAVK